MNRLTFFFSKLKFLFWFAVWREWDLFREEWNLTYTRALDAHLRSEEICQEAARRLLEAINEDTGA